MDVEINSLTVNICGGPHDLSGMYRLFPVPNQPPGATCTYEAEITAAGRQWRIFFRYQAVAFPFPSSSSFAVHLSGIVDVGRTIPGDISDLQIGGDPLDMSGDYGAQGAHFNCGTNQQETVSGAVQVHAARSCCADDCAHCPTQHCVRIEAGSSVDGAYVVSRVGDTCRWKFDDGTTTVEMYCAHGEYWLVARKAGCVLRGRTGPQAFMLQGCAWPAPATIFFVFANSCGGGSGAKAWVAQPDDCIADCPTDCSACCNTKTAVVSGGTAVDGTYPLEKSLSQPCYWEYIQAEEVSIAIQDGKWVLHIEGLSSTLTLEAPCSGANSCPPETGWVVVSNTSGGDPAVTVTGSDCP